MKCHTKQLANQTKLDFLMCYNLRKLFGSFQFIYCDCNRRAVAIHGITSEARRRRKG